MVITIHYLMSINRQYKLDGSGLTLLETVLCRVPETLPSAFYRGTRQRNILPSAALGKIKHSAKVALPSAGKSIICRVPRYSAKGGRPVTAATCRQILPSAQRLALGNFFFIFKNSFCRVPALGTRQFFFIF